MKNSNLFAEFEKDWQETSIAVQTVVESFAAFEIFKHAITLPPDAENSDNLIVSFPYLPTSLQEELYYFLQFLILQNQTPVSEEEQTEWDTKYLLLQRLIDPNPIRNTWEDLQTQISNKLNPVAENGNV